MMAVFLDHRGAFNKAWHAGTLRKLHQKGAPPRMLRWYAAFLQGRTAKVRRGTEGSKEWHFLPEGTPQGANSAATIVVPGAPCESVLYLKLSAAPPSGARMPANGPPFFTTDELTLVHDWIAEGGLEN